jgi:hypothetical protein
MSSTTTITMEHAMKQAITAAFKALEGKTYDVERDDFLDVLLADLFSTLFPHDSTVPAVAAPAAEPKKKVAKKAKKVDPEPVPAAADGPAAAGAGAPAAPATEEPKVKKAPKKAKKEDAPPADKNIEWSPTWTKRVKPVVKELGLTMNVTPAKQKEFAAHLNGLSKADYDARTFEEHMRDYLRASVPPAPAAAPKPSDGGRAAAGDDEVEVTEVVFKGVTYSVDTRKPDAMAVYNAEGTKHLGYVGSGDFADMKVTPDDTDEE